TLRLRIPWACRTESERRPAAAARSRRRDDAPPRPARCDSPGRRRRPGPGQPGPPRRAPPRRVPAPPAARSRRPPSAPAASPAPATPWRALDAPAIGPPAHDPRTGVLDRDDPHAKRALREAGDGDRSEVGPPADEDAPAVEVELDPDHARAGG